MLERRLVFIAALLILFLPFFVLGTDFSSTNFKIRDPIINIGGSTNLSSNNLKQTSAIGQFGIATSTSSSFQLRGGFLYFPFVTSPVVTATAGNAKVDLSWTSATAGVGWSVGGYKVGQSTTSGGPFSYTSLGNVLSNTASGLTNGTTYYFVVVVKDNFGNPIATSTQVSAIPTAPSPPPPPPPAPVSPGPSRGGGGGGGGGGPIIIAPTNSVLFTGRAYPKSMVTLLKDAQLIAKTVADDNADFNISLSDLSAGNYIFSIYSEDSQGRRSSLLTFPVSVTVGVQITIGGIFVAPTIDVDKSEVRRGDNIAIFGQTISKANITIVVNSDQEFFSKIHSDTNGIYLYNFDTSPLDYGNHFTKSKSASLEGSISNFSQAVSFTVGTKNIAKVLAAKKVLKGDLNGDGRVNLVDFSILAYWYKRPNPPAKFDLDGDGKIDLIDFSIMAFYWTG